MTEISHQRVNNLIAFAEVRVLWLTGATKGCSFLVAVYLDSITVKNEMIVGCI